MNPIITKYEDGSYSYSYKNKKNQIHRVNEPAYLYYNSNGILLSSIYFINGKRHRDNDPAVIMYNISGKVEEYYIHGFISRIDGPAVIWYNMNDKVIRMEYYFNDIRFSSLTEIDIYIKTQILI